MKTRLTYFIFCLSFILQAQDVFIANKTYPVVFEDTTLNANMKTNIVEDLTLYFTYSEDFSDAFKFDYVRNDGAVMFYHCNSISKDLFENLKCQHLGGTTNLFVNTDGIIIFSGKTLIFNVLSFLNIVSFISSVVVVIIFVKKSGATFANVFPFTSVIISLFCVLLSVCSVLFSVSVLSMLTSVISE